MKSVSKRKGTSLCSVLLGFSILFSTTVKATGEEFLDYGLYWFNVEYGQELSRKAVEHDGTVNAQESDYYDDSKPTVIFFHGWQSGTSELGYERGGYHYDRIDTNTMEAWKELGWNVGSFYWNQFADEDELKDAEAKIWSVSGPRGMRYRLDDGTYSTEQSPKYSVGRIAFEQVSAALANNQSGNVRLTGNSLGSQLAVVVAKQINDGIRAGELSEMLLPNRIELLDPFWSKGEKGYLGDANGDGRNEWTAERVRWYLGELINQRDIAVTWYKSSPILDLWVGDENTAMERTVAFVANRLWYYGSSEIEKKHVNITKWYYLSMASKAPKEVTIDFWGNRYLTGYKAASASTSDARIREMMGDRNYWDQVEGRYTESSADDQFQRKNH